MTLIRLTINLGFSVNPTIGGLIIIIMDYNALFWADGVTCILAGILLWNILNPKNSKVLNIVKVENPQSAYRGGKFLLFLVVMVLFGISFMQYFSTIPLYYDYEHSLSELHIGLLMGMNGFLIFVFEMLLVKHYESSKNDKN